jgi:hypothetical protein
MTQNGPYLGPPWNSGDDEPYTAPADPWGDSPTAQAPEAGWGAHPTSMPPVADSSTGYNAAALNSPPPAWGHPTAPPQPPKRRNTPILALVVVLGLLICGGLGTTAWLLNRQDTGNEAQGTPVQSATPAADNDVPGPQSSEDARFVKKGQCVRNDNTAAKPELKIVACASGTLEVLKRIDGRTTGEADAEQKCSKVPNYTKWFFYDSELDSLDFVLCMRER